MGRYLNVGLIQSAGRYFDFETCIEQIENDVRILMRQMSRPELVIGAEMAIGRYFREAEDEMSGDTIPGVVTDKLGKIAAEFGIYLMPGTMLERRKECGKTRIYNTSPIFGPDGRLIDTYSKICPYLPMEEGISSGDRYVTFNIEEKDITVGVMICHDWCFPEISRNLALRGAELLVRHAMDPEGLYDVCKSISQTRAFENQAYFLSMNMAGDIEGCHNYGHTTIAAPDGSVFYEAGGNPMSVNLILNMDVVSDAREFGTCYTEQLLRQLKYFNPPMDVYDNLETASVYRRLADPDLSIESRDRHLKNSGIQTIGKSYR